MNIKLNANCDYQELANCQHEDELDDIAPQFRQLFKNLTQQEHIKLDEVKYKEKRYRFNKFSNKQLVLKWESFRIS
jgi:hypothetical protein